MMHPLVRMCCAAAVATLALFSGASTSFSQTIIAQTGFNDQSGINSNPTSNSPYQLGQTIQGFGNSEPGWTSGWQIQRVNGAGGQEVVTAQSSAAKEGDGGLNFAPNDGVRALRTYTAQSRQFVIEQDINFIGVGDLQSRPGYNAFSEPAKFGPMWLLSGPIGDRRFYVSDGQGNGIPIWEDTGLRQVPGDWQHIKLAVDVVNQRYTFSVNGVQYASPDPLGFTGQPPGIDEIEYLTGSSGWVDSVIIRGADPAEPWRVADVNNDGHVTVGDLGILATHFNQTLAGGKSVGDLNLDGSVTVGDLGILATYFGQPAAAASTESFADALKQFPNLPASAVPEPSALGLIALAIPSALRRRRGRAELSK